MRNPMRSVVTVAVAAAAAGLLSSCAAESTTSSAAPAPSLAAAPSADATPSTAAAGAQPPVVAPTREAPLNKPTDLGGLDVTVTSIRPVQLVAQGPGQIAGPGAAVTVRLTNRTPKAVDGGALDVSATYGDSAASVNTGPPYAPAGTIEPGGSADATYTFVVPADQVDRLTPSITWTGAPDIVIITR